MMGEVRPLNTKLFANHRQEFKKCKSNTSVTMRVKSPNKSELKSSIPKPVPLRTKNVVSDKYSSSSLSKLITPSKIPTPVSRSVDGVRTFASVKPRSASNNPLPPRDLDLNRRVVRRTQTKSLSPQPRHCKPQECSKSASINTNTKGKYGSKPTETSKLKSRCSHTCLEQSPTPNSTVTKNSKLKSRDIRQVTNEESKMTNEEMFEQKRHILKIYDELMKLQPSKELKPTQKEMFKFLQNSITELTEKIKVNTSFLTESSPEFLVTFKEQMQDITEMWLHLIFDLLTNKMTDVNSTMSNKKFNVRVELRKILCSLACDKSEVLHSKLQIIDEKILKANEMVIQKATALYQQNEELKDNCFRLDKIQEQTHFELKEQIAILGKENQELDKKHEKAINMYSNEKAKTEQQEKYKLTINKELAEVTKILKIIEGRSQEWETRTKKAGVACKALELSIKNKEVFSEKENMNLRDLLNKLHESEITIDKLKLEIEASNAAQNSLKIEIKELQEQIFNKTTETEELEQQKNYLTEQLAAISKNINVPTNEIKSTQTNNSNNTSPTFNGDITSHVLIEDLTKDVYQKNIQILELKKKLSKVEYTLREKEEQEETLIRKVAELQKRPQEYQALLRAQIKDLKYELKSITEEKAHLEKIVVQKSLEIDQRDQLVRQHSHVLRARDELIPMFQNKEKRKEKDYFDKLSTIVFDNHVTYLSHGDDENSNNNLEPDVPEKVKALEKQTSLDPTSVDKELSFRQEKMTELFSLVEAKQIEMSRLERRMKELQGIREEKDELEKEKQARIYFLQRELQERKAGKSKGIFSLFSGQDGAL